MWNLHCEYTSQVFWCAVWVGGHSFKLAHLLGLHACFLYLVSFFTFLSFFSFLYLFMFVFFAASDVHQQQGHAWVPGQVNLVENT